MCISLKFYTRRGQMLTLSLCRSDLLFFERMRVTSLPGYLSLSRSFFFVGNSQSAHTHCFCVFSAGKKESTHPFFFFQKTPICLFQASYAYARSSLFWPRGNKKRTTGRRHSCTRDDDDTFFPPFFFSPHALLK